MRKTGGLFDRCFVGLNVNFYRLSFYVERLLWLLRLLRGWM